MTSEIVARRIVNVVLVLVMVSCVLVARGQQTKSNVLSDDDKAEIVESVLEFESSAQSSAFENFRKLSSDNIEFVEPSRISGHGFTLLPASEIRESKKDRVVRYMVFRRIYLRDGIVVVSLSRVIEGRPCFGPFFSSERNFTYEYQKNSGEWIGRLVTRPLQLSFSRKVATKP